ncbi:MAG: 30S ribosomal protein S17 [Candidatus Zambryskibacteria bacterium RIFCSPHIGHO2_01_FULL_43_25]|uniref:Small ribosomal subunit protein uS17 n=1 Tax=Candidatus Zambryskibacteria bacterium RIFCSPLOWO2_01_FULL_45_21 TaxID=1802761 RepID=A0A1G2U4J7_9BACT|nr:MAG: 30S ribosomal protein S17 [Candidatus Zambryskibacteria bacterium RIFCSPHIGHO2_01_FULL_43_25]OHB00849.1 MAG: 30S ribosomal protein S17 [Candidatus Zambryskibacteria bacterium RIFCSPHIGHO2_12_FULL_44_12b]OHB04423.1 MAG: 30S ribosomal protein S17 [Candidatus Zambryskibacteria bacterium RIFCSPLOWO2_01_FULL_45_21]
MEEQDKVQKISVAKAKTLKGFVVSDKMKDTVVVKVESYRKHKRYGKYVRSQKKYKAHDAGNTKKIGDAVTITETRPISKDKTFKVI